MTSIPLRIFIHGLIALVPTTDPGGTKVTALLVDNHAASSAPLVQDNKIETSRCDIPHYPKLLFMTDDSASCTAAGCLAKGSGECDCGHQRNEADRTKDRNPLLGKQVWLTITPSPALSSEKPSSALPAHPLPEDSRDAAKFSNVANLSREPFNLTIDQKYLAPNLPKSDQTHLAARMEIPYKDVTACSLAVRDEGGQSNVHAMMFRRLGERSDSGDIGYALAQEVVAELTVPDPGSGTTSVVLHIGDLEGGKDFPIRVVTSQDKDRMPVYEIELSNEMDKEDSLPLSHPCDDGIARHFEHFFHLAEPIPDGEKKTRWLTPHLSLTQFKGAAPLEPRVCKKKMHNLASHPICPMASFNP